MKNLALARLQALSIANTLPHAWLFTGTDNALKLQTARTFSQWQLCLDKQDLLPCGNCKSCCLFAAGTHPDFLLLTPAEDKTSILVDDVRAAVDFVAGKAQLGGYKIVLLEPAESMHTSAANALLKSLEEPCSETLFLLLCKHQNLLLKTIVSRCQILNFNVSAELDLDKVQQVLQDLRAVYIDKKITAVQIVEPWVKNWPQDILNYLEIIFMDLIRFKYTQDFSLLTNSNNIYAELSLNVSTEKIWELISRLQQAKYWLGNNYRLNQQLIIEDLLLAV